MGSKLFTINGTSVCALDALPTEQVPTTGLHWVRDQLQTDSAFQFLQKVSLIAHKLVLYSFVAVGCHDGRFRLASASRSRHFSGSGSAYGIRKVYEYSNTTTI